MTMNKEEDIIALETKIMELEKKLREEKERSHLLHAERELADFFTSQGVGNLKRRLARLKESTPLLEEESRMLRSKGQRDREWMKSLQEELESKEEEFKEKMIELKTEIRDLRCANSKAADEIYAWKKKCGVLQARALKVLDENLQLQRMEEEKKPSDVVKMEGAVKISDSDGDEKGSGEDLASAAGTKRMRLDKSAAVSGPEDDDADRMTPFRKLSTPISRCGEEKNGGAEGNSAKATQKTGDDGVVSNLKRAYTGRIPSHEEEVRAIRRADDLQRKLKFCCPSFIKKMTHSNVTGSFWLHIPSKFCIEYLSPDKRKMVLEDQTGLSYGVIFIGTQSALSGGWRRFSLDHNLELGDALVFELTEPERFKVYIIKAKEE